MKHKKKIATGLNLKTEGCGIACQEVNLEVDTMGGGSGYGFCKLCSKHMGVKRSCAIPHCSRPRPPELGN